MIDFGTSLTGNQDIVLSTSQQYYTSGLKAIVLCTELKLPSTTLYTISTFRGFRFSWYPIPIILPGHILEPFKKPKIEKEHKQKDLPFE